MIDFSKANDLLYEFKGKTYLHGLNVLEQVGQVASQLGQKVVLVANRFPGAEAFLETIKQSLKQAKVDVINEVDGARPNAPLEDLERITQAIKTGNPDALISFGGGSTIDACKAAEVLRSLCGTIEDYFGVGQVSQIIADQGKKLTPHVAIQTASSSGAHLTKYSNITNMSLGQKKLIVDDAIVPIKPVFDYGITLNAPVSLTLDGALDGIAHSLEVLYSLNGKEGFDKVAPIAEESIRLVVEYLPQVMDNPQDSQGREALGLATDLGGYAIMIGGTNGGHLTSFSLVDVLSHGRACALMNPYYTVFFAPAIEVALRRVGAIFKKYGYTDVSIDTLKGRALGVAVAEAMFAFAERIGFPTSLDEVKGFTENHIKRALTAAKNPQLKMKLQNMPIPLSAEMIDDYMGPILHSAQHRDLSIIQNL